MLAMLMGHLWRDDMPTFLAGLASDCHYWPLKDGED
jgi:hypothetical protein